VHALLFVIFFTLRDDISGFVLTFVPWGVFRVWMGLESTAVCPVECTADLLRIENGSGKGELGRRVTKYLKLALLSETARNFVQNVVTVTCGALLLCTSIRANGDMVAQPGQHTLISHDSSILLGPNRAKIVK
jgi:hypothetical protein